MERILVVQRNCVAVARAIAQTLPVQAPDFALPFESVQGLLLELARERSLERLLALVVTRLCQHDQVALARVWMVRDGDLCETCPMADECPGHIPCLHLVASAGQSVADPAADWSRLDGTFRRIPIGRRKVGSVAATTEPVCVEDTREDDRWIADPDWAAREGILGFGGQPMVYHGEILGVLGVFTHGRFRAPALASLRMLADHAAAAIANARAFEENARLRKQLEIENEFLRGDLSDAQAFGDILGVSGSIRQIEEQIEQVASTDASVLILGESGTGKELVAREIHRRSHRADKPMIRVNCASIPEGLYESEFFGHVKGAFTGAIRDRVGRFAAADGGTLFLDEVGEIPFELQSKLLRVLQEGQFERVGGETTHTSDVRIVAATNRSLAREVREGRFREDLFYRLNVFPIEVPPLRKRPEDIPLLAEHFLSRATRKHKRRARLTSDDMAALQDYRWPGNVRELQNAIERAVITAKNGRVEFGFAALERNRSSQRAQSGDPMQRGWMTDAAFREMERENLRAVLQLCGGKIYGSGGAAERLGMKPTTLSSRLQRLGIHRPKPD